MSVQTLLDTTVAATGKPLELGLLRPNDLEGRPPAFQATVVGTGSVSATVIIEASNDQVGWIALETMALSGTGVASDGFSLDAAWGFVRARCTAVTGTGARVLATVGV